MCHIWLKKKDIHGFFLTMLYASSHGSHITYNWKKSPYTGLSWRFYTLLTWVTYHKCQIWLKKKAHIRVFLDDSTRFITCVIMVSKRNRKNHPIQPNHVPTELLFSSTTHVRPIQTAKKIQKLTSSLSAQRGPNWGPLKPLDTVVFVMFEGFQGSHRLGSHYTESCHSPGWLYAWSV